MDDMNGEREAVRDSVYVEMSLLEKLRVKDVNQLISKPFSLGKVEEVYTFVKGSLGLYSLCFLTIFHLIIKSVFQCH